MRILIIEDDIETAQTLKQLLKRYYVVETASTGKEGERKAEANEYDVFLIDYLLPDTNGIEICKKLRKNGIRKPIILLTGNGEIGNKVAALNSGADDYVLKPYDIDELRARIEAVLRRSNGDLHSNILTIADLYLDLSKRKATRGGQILSLKRKEFDLLEYLMRNSGRVVTRSMIFDRVWSSETDSFTNVVDVHIKYLRDLVDRNSEKKLIKTVHGYGYKIEE
jgi:DNA-binding response OmpR family regulator